MVREWESRDQPVEEPANTIIRVVYEQRFDTSTKYEELAKLIRQLQALDKELHEMQLRSTKEGWKSSEDCTVAA